MALPENEFSVLSEGRFTKGAGEGWLEMLRRWLVQCPQCNEIRLVVGGQENDRHICKDCGHSFAISLSSPKNSSSV